MTERERYERASALFLEAAKLAPAARAALIAQRCADNAALRELVEEMIAARDEDSAFKTLAMRLASMPAAARGALGDRTLTLDSFGANARHGYDESPGDHIGRFQLLELIGEGGFGRVWVAEQREPVQRRVALKVIKAGMDTREVVARFEQERQALALMDHTNIAKVFDAGVTSTGRPYFVMELCKGDPIAEYCDKHTLSVSERLELFAQVCTAVQHAHTKGVIHRDIKPSNVLVSTQDGRPHAKVIDFGIAKAVDARLTEKTLFTEHRQLIGTPAYMSPEQAEGSLDIDTRTDVYSLGVLLYQLLTGSTPFSGKELRSAAYDEMRRIIREVDPPNPSTRLNENATAIREIAANRRTEPRKLGTLIRGELDWIVMKALEKDRARRYETANGLADDVRRFLSGEAIQAAPPSTAYRLRKFVSKHKHSVATLSAVGVALLLGLVGFAWQERAARAQRDLAIIAREDANQQRSEAQRQREFAEANAAAAETARRRSEAVLEFVTAALVSSDSPRSGRPNDVTILEAMQSAIEDIDSGRFATDPELEARLLNTIGQILDNNGRSREAVPLFERAIAHGRRVYADDRVALAPLLNNLAVALRRIGRSSDAERLLVEALEMIRKLHAGPHQEVVRPLANLAAVADGTGAIRRGRARLCGGGRDVPATSRRRSRGHGQRAGGTGDCTRSAGTARRGCGVAHAIARHARATVSS